MIRLPAAQITWESPILQIKVPPTFIDHITLLVGRLKTPYLRFDISKPGRPRTTGQDSQSHAINGFCQQIALETGQDFDTVKIAMKMKAIDRGYPFATEVLTGSVRPLSESELTSDQAAILIETIKQFAAEFGIRLIE